MNAGDVRQNSGAGQRGGRGLGGCARLGAALLAGSLGCGHVHNFEATPRNACAGDAVTVTWKADGKVSLDAQPPVPGIGPKADQCSESFVVARNTRFVLHARALLSSDHAERDIVVAPPTLEYGTLADCSPDSRAIVSSFEVKEVSPAAKLKGVVNVNARDIAGKPRCEARTSSFFEATSS